MDTDHGAVSLYSISSDKDFVPIKSTNILFKTKKRRSSKIILALALLVLILLTIIIGLAVIHLKTRSSYEVCSSEECIRIAASLKESMNTSVDPCDDFYEYACGRWSLEHPMPEGRSTNSWFTERTARILSRIRELLRKDTTPKTPWSVSEAVKLYASCVDIEALNDLGLSPLKNLLEELNLPEIPAIFSGIPGNLIKQLVQVKRNLGTDVFFGFDISLDPKNNTRNIMILGVPITSSPFPSEEYLDTKLPFVKNQRQSLVGEAEQNDVSISFQQVYMKTVIREVTTNGTEQICNSSNHRSLNDTSIARVVEEIYRLSQKIDTLIRDNSNDTSSEEIEDDDYMYVDDLQKVTDEYVKNVNDSLIPREIWRPFIEDLLIDYPDLDLTNKDKVLVRNLDYLKQVAFLMTVSDDKILEAIIWWAVLDIVVPHSSKNLRNAWDIRLYSDTSIEVWESRSMYCANTVNQLMGMAVAWLFVDQNFHESMGPNVTEMLDDIRTAFAGLVIQADWMDNKTKLATLQKSKLMGSAIGHPHWLFDEGVLDQYYDGINLTEDAFLNNMLQIVKLKSTNGLNSISYENDVNDTNSYWSTDPIDVNAFHSPQANLIIIPAGILQFPFYDLGLEALNYGAIGTVLGHELTHGFDNSGRHFDSFGNLRQWWTNETIRQYTDKAQCFIDHYNTYYEEEVDDHVDGELTLGENIADNGGLREAVWAYRRWKDRHGTEATLPGFSHVSSEQLLFLAFGHVWCESYTLDSLKWMLEDTHSPGRVRVTAVIKNSKEFSDAWKCPVGSRMNPEKKCRIW